MRHLRRRHWFRWLSALLFVTGYQVSGQQTETIIRLDTVLARFDGAVRIGTDIRGAVYVLDRTRATLTKLDSLLNVIATWGGPGAGDTELDEPADIDPTNGLSLVIADAGNRRVKRFSGEFVHLESLLVSARAQVSGVGDTGRRDVEPVSVDEGRPIAVRVAADGGIYAIDQDNAVILKWSRDRRVERVIGGYDAGDGGLIDPVALAIGREGRLFVADNGSATLKIFDRFGNYERAIGSGHLRDVSSVKRSDGRLLVVMPYRIAVYDVSGGLIRFLDVDTDEPLMDVAVWRDKLLLLTQTQLAASSFH